MMEKIIELKSGYNIAKINLSRGANLISLINTKYNADILRIPDYDNLDNPYLYVRFYLSGENGICYSQPMVLNVEGEEFAPVDVPETNDISTILRKLVTFLDEIFFKNNPLIWAFKYFALGYNALDRM